MTKFLFNPLGTAGDTYPHIAVGHELKKRGHEVVLLSIPNYRDLALSHGFEYVPVGKPLNYEEHAQDDRLKHSYSAWKAALDWAALGMMREVYFKIIEQSTRKPTLVVAPTWSLGARLAQEKNSVGLVNLVVNPILLRSCNDPPKIPLLPMARWTPGWFKRLQYWIADRFVLDPILTPKLNAFRRELGLKPVKRAMHRWWFSTYHVMGLFEPPFVTNPGDWAVPVELVGHTRWDAESNRSLIASERAFLDDPRGMIIYLPGSAGPQPSDLIDRIRSVCRTLRERLLVLCPLRQGPQIDNQTEFLQLDYVPLKDWTHRCKLLIHSGGVGALSHALKAGIPQLVFPTANDQFDNARRLTLLGVAKSIDSHHRQSNDILRAIKELTNSSEIRKDCEAVRAMCGSDSASRIADRLEQLAQRHS